jgi:hypothetical protein
MNLVLADIKEGANGLELHVGGSTLEIPQSTLDERPALKGYAGQQVALACAARTWRMPRSPRCPTSGA